MCLQKIFFFWWFCVEGGSFVSDIHWLFNAVVGGDLASLGKWNQKNEIREGGRLVGWNLKTKLEVKQT